MLLEVPPWSQIMPPQPINEKVLYPGYKETLFPLIFVKIVAPTENTSATWLMRFRIKSSVMDT